MDVMPPEPDTIIDEIIMGEIVFEDFTFYEDPNHIYTFPEKMPEYNGGYQQLFHFIGKNLQFPKWEQDRHITGRVFVEFIVETDGSLSNIHILKSVEQAKNFDKEVIRVLQMMPNWTPGNQNGIPVRTKMIIPIKFEL